VTSKWFTPREIAAMKNVRSLGIRVRKLRTVAGWTQQELADRSFVSRKWLIDLERGKATVAANRVLDVLQALGYEIELVPLRSVSEPHLDR
jgi:HTH-type transcriptional regulator/antitoxin HipB